MLRVSHFDDIAPLAAIFVFVVIMTVIAIDSKATCEQHGEKYVDGWSGYTLCERKDGTVVKR
jgi:hypothetical protein